MKMHGPSYKKKNATLRCLWHIHTSWRQTGVWGRLAAVRCVGKVGSSLQYDHRLAVGRNFKGTGSRQYVRGQEPCRSSLAWPQSSVRAEKQEGRSSQMRRAREAPKQTAEIRKLMLSACTACAKTSCTAPRKYCENTERHGDRKWPTYAQPFNTDIGGYPADVPTTVSVTSPHTHNSMSQQPPSVVSAIQYITWHHAHSITMTKPWFHNMITYHHTSIQRYQHYTDH
jgi:hypothetical protein